MKYSSNRFDTNPAAAIALVAGVQDLEAQDQAGMFADADHIESADMSFAYATGRLANWFYGLAARWKQITERNLESPSLIDQVPRTVRLVPEKEPEVIDFSRRVLRGNGTEG